MGIAQQREFSRRAFLATAGGLGLSAALAGLPSALSRLGLLDEASAADADLTRDTISGLAAFVVPGNDEYSRAQGVSTNEPGAVEAGAVPGFIATLDDFVAAPLVGGETELTVPVSGAVATLLNEIATQVNPASARGSFPSPFARLSFEEKAEVFRRFESDPAFADTEFRFVAGILPGFAAFFTYCEAPAYEGGRLTRTPVGWQLANYDGPSDGWNEFKGYYRGRRAARRAHRFVRHEHA